jgi:hypothetical protein
MAIHGEWREGAALTFAADPTAPVGGNQEFWNTRNRRENRANSLFSTPQKERCAVVRGAPCVELHKMRYANPCPQTGEVPNYCSFSCYDDLTRGQNMRRAILLTGFNNWGKTTHINSMFRRERFFKNATYQILTVNAAFTVESHSNDDLGEIGFINAVDERLTNSPDKGKNLFCAFCPTREPDNDSYRILTSPPMSTYDEIHILFLQYKWDFHAELRITDIQKYLAGVQNLHLFTVNADAAHVTDATRRSARETQIVGYLQGLYP